MPQRFEHVMTRQRREINGEPAPWLGDTSEPVAAKFAELQQTGFEVVSAAMLADGSFVMIWKRPVGDEPMPETVESDEFVRKPIGFTAKF